jgi:hypothetical protein
MTEFRIPPDGWMGALADALRDAVPGDTVIVRTEPMLRVAESAAQRMGKEGVTLTIADKLDD